jgi:hypothetical protein
MSSISPAPQGEVGQSHLSRERRRSEGRAGSARHVFLPISEGEPSFPVIRVHSGLACWIMLSAAHDKTSSTTTPRASSEPP